MKALETHLITIWDVSAVTCWSMRGEDRVMADSEGCDESILEVADTLDALHSSMQMTSLIAFLGKCAASLPVQVRYLSIGRM